ncbi:MAG: hypothetical protein PVJ67_04305 [Candidatus Pacearchaeota archaeon]|jgi:hypothetical protein
MLSVAVLYYTANREDEYFENKVKQNILKNKGSLPLVSVSQKPIDFGRNICVGMHDNCYLNEFRQIQIGLREIDTDYILTAESDFLYPPDYFSFRPTTSGKCYRYWPVWICYYKNKKDKTPKYHFKGYSNGAQMIDRKLWLRELDRFFKDHKIWASSDDELEIPASLTIKTDPDFVWSSDIPAVSFKTGYGVNPATEVSKKLIPRWRLQHWGLAKDLRKEMFGG